MSTIYLKKDTYNNNLYCLLLVSQHIPFIMNISQIYLVSLLGAEVEFKGSPSENKETISGLYLGYSLHNLSALFALYQAVYGFAPKFSN